MNKAERLQNQYRQAINRGRESTQAALRMAAFVYLDTGQRYKLSRRVAAIFERDIKPYLDYLKAQSDEKK